MGDIASFEMYQAASDIARPVLRHDGLSVLFPDPVPVGTHLYNFGKMTTKSVIITGIMVQTEDNNVPAWDFGVSIRVAFWHNATGFNDPNLDTNSMVGSQLFAFVPGFAEAWFFMIDTAGANVLPMRYPAGPMFQDFPNFRRHPQPNKGIPYRSDDGDLHVSVELAKPGLPAGEQMKVSIYYEPMGG